ncbi:MAG TPA: pyruvate formate-lyase-activating protein [Syntrophomonas sp.]|nr:pyruvate formate-lyase-activating protein [Syntrophomonas sp.]HPT70016.1 pyruvate formate-lyase-activating protein [Syntrophomonas sp.]
MQSEAYIHSIETMGMVDGPGIRYVIFMQGCPLRCSFCHNPDSWHMSKGQTKSLQWLLTDIKDYLPYFRSSGGGVTVSGGEPLLQAEFLELLFAELKKLDIHRVIDTSGFAALEKVKKLIALTDLVMLSIKHPDPEKHREISGQSPERPLAFARYLTKINMPVWIRYVLIPGVSDSQHDLALLAAMIKNMPNVQRLELLPYNTMGKSKWEQLGISSPLLDIPSPQPQEVEASGKTMAGLLPGLKIV